MANKKFDPKLPHDHICANCHKAVYCAAVRCELPHDAECFECQNGYVVTERDGQIAYWKKRPQRFEGDTRTA